MRCTSIAEKICTVCEYIRGISDSMKGSSSRIKNKAGAQKGAFIKMKQENIYIYQREYVLCYVPIIAPSFIIKSYNYCCIALLFLTRMCIFARCECGKIVAGTVRFFVAQCKGMLTACVTLKLPSILSFEQYYYFDGFWLRMLTIQCLPARMGRKDVTTKAYIQTLLVVHFGICILD